MTDDELQSLWDVACNDTPQNPGWCRHLRYGRAVLAAQAEKLNRVEIQLFRGTNCYEGFHKFEFSDDGRTLKVIINE